MRLAGVVLFCFQLWAQDARYAPQGDQIPGPPTPAEFSTWLNDIRHWRAERLIRAGYSSKEYERPELAWSQRDWSAFLAASIGQPFGESDPYFATDLGFFVYRLPRGER